MSNLSEVGGWPALLTELLDRRDLTSETARVAMASILAGESTAAQLVGFIVALRAKGETAEEVSGLLDAVFDAATLVPLPAEVRNRAVDLVGTGGDRSHSINVSTISSLVVAGAGVPVCKHGARAASSKCGAADLLEALGVRVELDPEGVARCIEHAGIGFCLAAAYHPAFRFMAASRKEIGIPTVFNLLGPMANPGRVRRQLIGVANPKVAELMVTTLRAHGSTRAWVVNGGGLDELTTVGTSTVLELVDGGVRSFTVDPLELGISRALSSELEGGEPAENAEHARRVLAGDHGPHRDIILLNAGAALVVSGVAADLSAGMVVAAASIDSGAAEAALLGLIDASNA